MYKIMKYQISFIWSLILNQLNGCNFGVCNSFLYQFKVLNLLKPSGYFTFVWVWNLVVDIAGGKEAEGIWEHGVEENIWT